MDTAFAGSGGEIYTAKIYSSIKNPVGVYAFIALTTPSTRGMANQVPTAVGKPF